MHDVRQPDDTVLCVDCGRQVRYGLALVMVDPSDPENDLLRWTRDCGCGRLTRKGVEAEIPFGMLVRELENGVQFVEDEEL